MKKWAYWDLLRKYEAKRLPNTPDYVNEKTTCLTDFTANDPCKILSELLFG